MPDLPPTYTYQPFVDVGRRLARWLRAQHRLDLVVALTHMRVPNDERLAREVPEIDLVLGGHDHFYYVSKDPVTQQPRVVKSGSDFMQYAIFVFRGLCLNQ